MNATTEGARDQSLQVIQPDQGQQVIGMLERVLTAKTVDMDRAERLWAMMKEIRSEQSKAAYFAGLSQMQADIPSIKRTGKIKNNAGAVQSTYAKWEHVVEGIKPVLQRHGFALDFKVVQGGEKGERITVTAFLSHTQGHQQSTEITLAPDTTGSKNAPQAVVSAISYGKRCTAGLLLNIASHDEDDDGQNFGNPDQTDELMAKVTDFEVSIMEAIDEVELSKIGRDIAGAGLPPRLQTRVRKAYSTRLHELRAAKAVQS